MKKFEELKIGDNIFIGLEKKTIIDIQLDSDILSSLKIQVNSGEYYTVTGCLSYDYCVGLTDLIFTEKEAIIEYYTKKLKEILADFETCNSYYKMMLEKAKNLK